MRNVTGNKALLSEVGDHGLRHDDFTYANVSGGASIAVTATSVRGWRMTVT